MPFTYVNRRGEEYHLMQGKTKTGKPKYYVSRKPGGDTIDTMPAGFEIYENPERGLVSVRKIRPTRILPSERDRLLHLAQELTGNKLIIVDIQDDSLVIYTTNANPAASASVLGKMFGSFPPDLDEWFTTTARYSATLRFVLADEKKRLFSVERWCFRGSIDDWIHLAGAGILEAHAQNYLPHLFKESFYELI